MGWDERRKDYVRNEVKVRGENNELHSASNLVLLVMWKGMSGRGQI